MRSILISLLLVYSCHSQNISFPDDFLFGVSTASYQVEGGWNANGKGENIWDRLTHTRPELIADRSTGDIACDTYNKAIEDVQLLKNLGVDFYRFSVSWSRILPTGYTDQINPDGIRYYNELIDELLANGIKPYVTMFHWDLPQPLQDIGGWPNSLVVQIFEDYADVLYKNFGDRVKDWMTFNEPRIFCSHGYETASMAPAVSVPGIGAYLCSHTVLQAHGKAYRLYEAKYKEIQKGRVGISINSAWIVPATDEADDVLAATTYLQLSFGLYAHPIFSSQGDYPPIIKQRIAALSADEGFPRSRLPEFTPKEIEEIRGSADFLGFNHYTSQICSRLPEGSGDRPSLYADGGALCWQDEEWESGASPTFKVVPWGFRNILNWIKDEYNNPEVIITENGFSDKYGLEDCRRINYYNLYLEELLKAISVDGCNITGYTAWSFMDNFEWNKGYTDRFGLYFVDFEDPDRPRVPKMSAYNYKNILSTRKIDWDYTPAGFQECDFGRGSASSLRPFWVDTLHFLFRFL